MGDPPTWRVRQVETDLCLVFGLPGTTRTVASPPPKSGFAAVAIDRGKAPLAACRRPCRAAKRSALTLIALQQVHPHDPWAIKPSQAGAVNR